jgi:hypothetical protein
MKAGRASLYADRVLRYKAKNGVPWYLLGFAFQEDFVKTFCPKSKAQIALTWLKTVEYHQGHQTIDKYTDKFQDLIKLAGYTNRLVIVHACVLHIAMYGSRLWLYEGAAMKGLFDLLRKMQRHTCL